MPSTWWRGPAGDGSNPGALPPPTPPRVRLSAEGHCMEIPRYSGTFPKHLLTGQTREGPKVALWKPILSEAVDLADLVRIPEALHLQWVAGASRGGEFE